MSLVNGSADLNDGEVQSCLGLCDTSNNTSHRLVVRLRSTRLENNFTDAIDAVGGQVSSNPTA